MPLTILMYGDCTSYNGWIGVLDYRGVGLERSHCTALSFIAFVNGKNNTFKQFYNCEYVMILFDISVIINCS